MKIATIEQFEVSYSTICGNQPSTQYYKVVSQHTTEKTVVTKQPRSAFATAAKV